MNRVTRCSCRCRRDRAGTLVAADASMRIRPTPTTTFFRPDSRLAVTIPTVDPQRGRLTGIAVQLMTLVVDQAGELHGAPHAEWSVRTVWT